MRWAGRRSSPDGRSLPGITLPGTASMNRRGQWRQITRSSARGRGRLQAVFNLYRDIDRDVLAGADPQRLARNPDHLWLGRERFDLAGFCHGAGALVRAWRHSWEQAVRGAHLARAGRLPGPCALRFPLSDLFDSVPVPGALRHSIRPDAGSVPWSQLKLPAKARLGPQSSLPLMRTRVK